MILTKTFSISRWLTAFIAVFPALVLIGWTFDIDTLKRISAGMTAMNPVTAICFILCAFQFYIYRRTPLSGKAWIHNALASVVLLAGILKLMEYLDIAHIYFDRYLYTSEISKEPGFNAIAPNTAMLFIFSGILFLNRGKSERERQVNDILRISGLLIAYLGLMGYVYSVRNSYKIGPFVPMALSTVICFISLFFNAVIIMPRGKILQVFSSELAGGKLARAAIPVLLLLPAAFGYVGLLGQRYGLYETEYGTALYTAFFLLLSFMLIYIYAIRLNRKDLEQRVSNLRIIESEEKYRTLIDTMKEGVVYFNRSGSVVFCNKGFTEISGYPNEEVISQNLVDLLGSSEMRPAAAQNANDQATDISSEYETELVHKLGYKVAVSVVRRPIFKNKEQTEMAGSFVTLTDITERNKMIGELNSFSAVAAHDLNAPLTRIEMLASLLDAEAAEKLTEDEQLYITLIINTARHSKLMLKDLLRFAKLSTGNLTKEPISLPDLVKEALEMGRHLNPNARVVIDDLPEVEADGPALLQVYTNLISNALKFSAKKEEPLVHIGSYHEDEKTIFFVKDNGDGFDMAKAAHLFVPFHRMHSDFEGNGLGLPIVKRIIEKHGGQLWAEAQKGEGASFYFTL